MDVGDLSFDRRVKRYKECCFRAYAYGLASLSIAAPISYFGLSWALRNAPIRRKYITLFSGVLGSYAAYKTSKYKSQECNEILRAHRESLIIAEEQEH